MRAYTSEGLEPSESATQYAARVGADVAGQVDVETELTQLHRVRVAQVVALGELRAAREEVGRVTWVERVVGAVFGVRVRSGQ